MTLTNNITDTALIFEGGGMRASYTSAVVNELIDQQMFFNWVAGISAGSSNLANYLSRDKARAQRSFGDFAADPNFGSMKTFIQGKGLFNSQYIYEETSAPDQALPFDWDTFSANPAKFRIGTFNSRTGRTQYWTNDDVPDMATLMRVVRASSSLPILMPPVELHGDLHFDGAIGTSGGVALDIAIQDGYEKFFIVLTRPRSYVKEDKISPNVYRSALREFPLVADAVISRPARYNETKEQIIELEREGKAYVFWAEDMMVDTGEKDVAKLSANHQLGVAQAKREVPKWREFLGL